MMKRIIAFLGAILPLGLLSSCEVKELPVPMHDAGSVLTTTVDMSPTYKTQVFYSLQNNAVVGTADKMAWDLGFESGAAGFHIVLNTSKFMYAYKTNKTVFSAVTDTLGFNNGKKWDEPSGNLDSTAIGDWRTGEVYIIDRGYNETGVHQGYRKMLFVEVNAANYVVKYARLNGAGEVNFTIPKNDEYNFTFLAMSTAGALVTVEPPKEQWDLCFTQYMHIFYNPTMPYLVTGCLHNRYNTTAVKEKSKSFSQLIYSDVNTYTFSSYINTIGYDWKTFAGTTYTTDPSSCYLIKTQKGQFYKLHFIDFYNSNGDKGNPKWEYQAL